MSLSFFHDVNFNGNIALNMVIQPSTSATRPANPEIGMATFDTDIKAILTWDGTKWKSQSDQDAILGVTAVAPLNASEDAGTRVVNLTIDGASALSLGVIQLAGDFDAASTAEAPILATIGKGTENETAVADIKYAADAAHDQNTDTSTTSATFQLDSGNSGPLLKNVSGELQTRNAGDTDFADLRVKNLVVEGTTTQINSNEVNIGDNKLLLNSDITTNAENSDGGLAVKRLQADNTTRADAEINLNNSTGRWQVTDGAVTAVTTFNLARSFAATVGDDVATSFVITHNMNTQDLSVSIREVASPFALVMTEVEFTSVNTVTVKFKKAPTANQFRVTLVG